MHIGVDFIIGLCDLQGVLVDLVWFAESVSLRLLRVAAELVFIRHQSGRQHVQMTAWGSFAREVPNLNFRSFSLVSVEKVYSRDSEDCNN